MDITDVILDQHHEQRRAFAILDQVPRDDHDVLAAVWGRLQVLLEVHADAEERFFYPALLQIGRGTPDGGVDDEVEDAIKDHNDIRDGIRASREHPVGSDEWWAAVWAARKANDDHMAEEEREDLMDFRRHADLQTRHDIAVEFLGYESRHSAGIPVRDKDPGQFIDDHS